MDKSSMFDRRRRRRRKEQKISEFILSPKSLARLLNFQKKNVT
jgi:hypothetical protein